MRDIRFRGKSLKDGTFVYGMLGRYGSIYYIIAEDFDPYGVYCCENIDIDNDTIGQFTGLKDINGNDIYEGDILEDFSGCRHLVKYEPCKAAYRLVIVPDIMEEMLLCDNSVYLLELRVVCNIHDNNLWRTKHDIG